MTFCHLKAGIWMHCKDPTGRLFSVWEYEIETKQITQINCLSVTVDDSLNLRNLVDQAYHNGTWNVLFLKLLTWERKDFFFFLTSQFVWASLPALRLTLGRPIAPSGSGGPIKNPKNKNTMIDVVGHIMPTSTHAKPQRPTTLSFHIDDFCMCGIPIFSR